MATMIAPIEIAARTRVAGGAFLIMNPTAEACFFPEDFTEEHKQIAKATADFATKEVVPQSDAIEAKDFSVTRRLMKAAYLDARPVVTGQTPFSQRPILPVR